MCEQVLLDGAEIEPADLRDFDGVAFVEIVDGQFRVATLKEESHAAD